MSFGSGSLTIAARRAGSRTVLERVRYEGISRCSRAFAVDGAALVVLSQLGPGVVRGDAVTTAGHVRAGAHLIVTSQAATRLMGGARRSGSHATWIVEDDATLEIIGEPLVASGAARHESTTSIHLAPGAVVVMSDIAAVPRGADVRLRTSVTRGGRELFYDAFEAGAAAPLAVGTLAIVGLAPGRVAALVDALDVAAEAASDLRLGIGALSSGAFARILAPDIWPIRSALQALRDAAWSVLRSQSASRPGTQATRRTAHAQCDDCRPAAPAVGATAAGTARTG
jgi:urease accessory protein UreH